MACQFLLLGCSNLLLLVTNWVWALSNVLLVITGEKLTTKANCSLTFDDYYHTYGVHEHSSQARVHFHPSPLHLWQIERPAISTVTGQMQSALVSATRTEKTVILSWDSLGKKHRSKMWSQRFAISIYTHFQPPNPHGRHTKIEGKYLETREKTASTSATDLQWNFTIRQPMDTGNFNEWMLAQPCIEPMFLSDKLPDSVEAAVALRI
jgi:hypothetical protein